MKRLFIALPIDDSLRDALSPATDELAGYGSCLKRVDGEHYHITVKFLGETTESLAGELARNFQNLSGVPIPFILKGLGTFPPSGAPSVIWAGIECGPSLGGLVSGVEGFCAGYGFPLEKRPFSPHLTLARVRREKTVPLKLLEYIKSNSGTVYGSGTFSSLVLFQSVLTPRGPVYTPLETLTLKEK